MGSRWARAAALVLVLAGPAAADETPAPEPAARARARVEHHLRQVDELIDHFEGVLAAGCPRFEAPGGWDAFVDAELDRVVSLVAHLDQAWIEAKRSGDDELRREAKAPRRGRRDEAKALVGKLQRCAADNGTTLPVLAVWHRIEQALPERRAAIALPE